MGMVINDPRDSKVRADERAAHEVKMQIIEKLGEIRDGLEEEVSAELSRVMVEVQQLSVEMCPKETGALASSISLVGGSLEKSSGADFFECSIYAGSEDIVNPISGVPTSQYAELVHDGHTMRDGMFWSGVPFLTDALAAFEDELNSIVDKALKEMDIGE